MIEGVEYVRLKGNEELIKEYFNALFFFREKKVISALKMFSEMKGYAVNDYMSCHFANEFSKNEEEYFGESGVAFYYEYPVVQEDKIVVLTYQEFYIEIRKNYEEYIKNDMESREVVLQLMKEMNFKMQ